MISQGHTTDKTRCVGGHSVVSRTWDILTTCTQVIDRCPRFLMLIDYVLTTSPAYVRAHYLPGEILIDSLKSRARHCHYNHHGNKTQLRQKLHFTYKFQREMQDFWHTTQRWQQTSSHDCSSKLTQVQKPDLSSGGIIYMNCTWYMPFSMDIAIDRNCHEWYVFITFLFKQF